jgi:hypothetical protein
MHAAVFVSSISKTTIQRIRKRRNPEKTAHRHRFAPTAQCEKNRRRAVVENVILAKP